MGIFKTWTVPMAPSIYIRLASTSHQGGELTTAIFDTVLVSQVEISDVGTITPATEYRRESDSTNDRVIRAMASKVGFIADNSWVVYESFNFGTLGVSSIDVLASNGTRGGVIELRLGSATGTLIGNVEVIPRALIR